MIHPDETATAAKPADGMSLLGGGDNGKYLISLPIPQR